MQIALYILATIGFFTILNWIFNFVTKERHDPNVFLNSIDRGSYIPD